MPENKMQKQEQRISPNLLENMVALRSMCDNSSDIQDRQIFICGVKVAILMCEGMVSMQTFTESMMDPLMKLNIPNCTGQMLAEWVAQRTVFSGDQKEFYTYGELFSFLMSGFVVLLIEGVDKGIACGLQGYSYRSISEPSTEMNVRGSREGFVEPIRVNQSMIRRRIKSPTLKFDLYSIGERSKTDISLVYLTDVAKPELVAQIKHQLTKLTPDIILSSGYLQPFLEGKPLSLFSRVGVTERPDVLCSKINEGRVCILVDGTPFALVVPQLFSEHFQSLDDYAYRPFYAVFIRVLKYLSFFISILLPGMYVAISVFDPELLPDPLLFNIAASEEITPFPMMLEALVIHFLYEIMREAGLRLPRPVGHAGSIVGALVIGDAAVNAGLIGSPMVMIVALTAISSFVVASLYETVAILKFVFIFLGGTWGFYGIALGLMALLVNVCAMSAQGVPYTAPASPFSKFSMRDTWLRAGWRTLGKKQMHVQDMPGSQLK